ncbi:MAG: SURF1 family protein [Alphaproteobacteria bacterium]|nr:SURF1 family protein [Alphaproteobacteria bacterium]
MLGLGVWQLQRMAWKNGLIAEMQAGMTAPPVFLEGPLDNLSALSYRAVRLRGQFLHDMEAHVGPRVHQGQAGLHVLTPLRLEDGATILINRGWIPKDRRDPASRAAGQLPGEVTVQGILRSQLSQGTWTPDHDSRADLWFWYDVAGIAKARGLDLAAAVVQADGQANPGGLPIGGVAQPRLKNDHLQYAITWFSLAGVLMVIFLLSHRRAKDRP